MGLERAYPTRAEFLDHIRRDWRSAHSIRKGIYDYVELDYSKVIGLTAKSIPYAGADGKLTQDNAELFWDYSTDTLHIGTISISDGSIIDSGGSISFGNENLVTTGTLGCGTITVANGGSINLQEDITFTGATAQNLIKFPDNLVTALSFREGANAYLTFKTTNAAEAVIFGKVFTGITGSTIGNLTFANGSITDSGGSISFGNENLLTTGTLGCGAITSTGSVTGINMVVNAAVDWRNVQYQTSGVLRFAAGISNAAESGSNVGSDYMIHRYDDAGGWLDYAFFIKRSSGKVGIRTATPYALLHINDGVTSGLSNLAVQGIIISDSTQPSLVFEDTGEGAGDRVMFQYYANENMVFASMTDDGSAVDVDNILVLNRDGNISMPAIPAYATNALARAGGLVTGDLYHTLGETKYVMIVGDAP